MNDFPVMLTLHLGPSDQALREFIRLEEPLPAKPVQKVICENARYADLIYSWWVNQRVAAGKGCGGGWHERYIPPQT